MIVDPKSGDFLKHGKFQLASNIKRKVRERAGVSVKTDSKSEPLRSISFGRVDCLCCAKGKPGKLEKNSAWYRIKCDGGLVNEAVRISSTKTEIIVFNRKDKSIKPQ